MNAITGVRPVAAGRVAAGRAGGPIVLAAGGTGGHFFPAEALGAALLARGRTVVLMTDGRSGGERSAVFAPCERHVLSGAGLVGRGPVRAARAAVALAVGTVQARRVLGRLGASVVVGFGGYPSVGPVLAARSLARRSGRRPVVVLHEGNAVLGGANRVLARFADHLALSFEATARVPQVAATVTGLPVRAGFQPAPYEPPGPGEEIRLLVVGGSLGARVLSQVVPAAVALLPGAVRDRLRIVQQCRAEDMEAVRASYATAGVAAELATFLDGMPARMAAAHLVVGRAGASTVAELAAVGRPALLVPLPSVDGHQRLNAVAVDAGVVEQNELTPGRLAEVLAHRLLSPDLLAASAHAVGAHGIPDATARLADLVERLSEGLEA